jgi:hypothetical protein
MMGCGKPQPITGSGGLCAFYFALLLMLKHRAGLINGNTFRLHGFMASWLRGFPADRVIDQFDTVFTLIGFLQG